jgi:hypothetical protein
LHGEFLKVWDWGDKDGFFGTIGKDPGKATIAIGEDALLIWWLSSCGGHGGDEGGTSGGLGGGGAGIPGRGGGPGTP